VKSCKTIFILQIQKEKESKFIGSSLSDGRQASNTKGMNNFNEMKGLKE
jgi:hypothetical protein